MPYFAERGIETYAVSLRAHGGSDGAESDAYSMADQLDDISCFVSSLPAPPVLIGHSLGGVIAQRWALLWWLDASATRRCRNYVCCFDVCDDKALAYAMSRSPPCHNWAGKVAGTVVWCHVPLLASRHTSSHLQVCCEAVARRGGPGAGGGCRVPGQSRAAAVDADAPLVRGAAQPVALGACVLVDAAAPGA